MKLISLYRVKLRRLLLSKGVWLVAILSLCAPLFGYSLYHSIRVESMTGDYIGNPVLAGTTIGALLWAVLAMKESNHVYRNNTSVLTDAIASPSGGLLFFQFLCIYATNLVDFDSVCRGVLSAFTQDGNSRNIVCTADLSKPEWDGLVELFCEMVESLCHCLFRWLCDVVVSANRFVYEADVALYCHRCMVYFLIGDS